MAPWYAWTPWGGEFAVARLLLQRGLALTYLVGFLVAARQFRPLAGEDGLLPLRQYVERYEFRQKPSLFYVFDSDRALAAPIGPVPRRPTETRPRPALSLRVQLRCGTPRDRAVVVPRAHRHLLRPVSLDDSRFRLTLQRRGWDVPGPERDESEEREAITRIAETE